MHVAVRESQFSILPHGFLGIELRSSVSLPEAINRAANGEAVVTPAAVLPPDSMGYSENKLPHPPFVCMGTYSLLRNLLFLFPRSFF